MKKRGRHIRGSGRAKGTAKRTVRRAAMVLGAAGYQGRMMEAGEACPYCGNRAQSMREGTQQHGRFWGTGPKNYSRSDERIQEEVCDRLMEQGKVDCSDVSVTVEDGVVIMEGSVDRREDKHMLESIVESVLGVKDVNNQLHVEHSPYGSSGRSSSQRMSTISRSGAV